MSALSKLYLALAVWGAVHPMFWFVTHVRETGTGLPGLFEAWFATASTTGLAWDVTIAGTALFVWIIAETRVRRNWRALWAIPATLFIGLSCGLPLYLFLRTRGLD